MRVFLLLNGEVPDLALAKRAAAACETVLCADGGLRHAAPLGLAPRFVIGDMDSLPRKRPGWPETTYVCDFDEGRSDFEKALDFAAQMGAAEVWVAGALGGRLDCALANLAALEVASTRFSVTLIDRGYGRILEPGRHLLACRPNDALSLLPCSAAAVVSLGGVRRPLRRARLSPGAAALACQTVSGSARLEVHRGRVWLLRP